MAKKTAPHGYPKGNWSESSLKVMNERYLAKDKFGNVSETPEGMVYRVAKKFADEETKFGLDKAGIEKLTRDFYGMMIERRFMPNSPTLMNAGRDNKLQYSGCFVIPIGDSIEEIFDAIKYAALIHKSGGGTGFSFSRLRPKGSIVSSTTGVASGPVSFMRVFDSATNEIKQGGTRRGANMGILRVDHPDILEFIESKASGGITNFNISVAVTDVFMKAVKSDREYALIDPKGKKKVGKLKAKEVFEKIAFQAWKSGDPGVIFIDRVNAGSANPVPEMGPVEATNPCGEQPLYPNEACNLGSINLAQMANSKKPDRIDWEKLKKTTHLATRFLDDVVEANPFPLEEITRVVQLNRRIGLGVMGWADLLFKLEIPYDSSKAKSLAKKIMGFVQKESHLASQDLAKSRGAFPNFAKSIYKNGVPMRNATTTTIAPTGTISIIADCSSGVEPIFALCFKHKAHGRELTFVNPYFKEEAKKAKLSESVLKKVENQGNLHGIEEVSEKIRKIFVTAHEVGWKDHVDMQAAFQAATDNAVSKTINLPNNATLEEVKQAYLHSYQSGCLGITVFRDGSKSEQVLYSGVNEAKKEEVHPEVALTIKKRPRVVSGQTYRVETPVGTAFVTVNINGNNEPLEVFIAVGKAGSAVAADAEALGRLISMNLRIGSIFSTKEVVGMLIDQLDDIGGGESIGFGKERVRSLADGIAQVLKEYNRIKDKETVEATPTVNLSVEQPNLLTQTKKGDLCPVCGRPSLIFEEGCTKCLYCGYNKC
jgi:ribonucleoside-diphosphate reductase alpha chain